MSSKRKQGGRGDGPNKKYKVHKHKWTVDSNKGIRALMVTCDQGKERQAAQEMTAWVTHVADSLYPRAEENEDEAAAVEGEGDTPAHVSVSSALEEELKLLKAQSGKASGGAGKSSERVTVVRGLPKGIILLHLKDRMDPVLLARTMVQQMLDDHKSYSRYSVRLIPLARTCFSDVEDLKTMAKPLIPAAFKDVPLASKYSVILERRGGKNTRVERGAVIRAMADLVPPGYGVDLNNPDVVILVQVVGRTTGLSVLRSDYLQHCKYNIRTLQDRINDQLVTATTTTTTTISATTCTTATANSAKADTATAAQPTETETADTNT